MNLRICMPRTAGRGAGLGNELIPWARAFIAGQILDAKVLPPAFALNPRGYRKHFGTSRLDWLTHRLIERALPRFEFGEREYLDCGGGDVAEAITEFANKHGLFERTAYVLVTEGMWGGYVSLERAREFVRSQLSASRYAQQNLFQLGLKIDPSKILVTMHVRLGDFNAPLPDDQYRGKFNVSLPLAWYENIAGSLRKQFGDGVQFLVLSDGRPEQLGRLTTEFGAITSFGMANTDCSDLLALAAGDLVVCSVSSFSAWAAFLSDSPYLWFEPNLQCIDGFHSIWGHEMAQQISNSPTQKALRAWRSLEKPGDPRGIVVGIDGQLPESLLFHLKTLPGKRAKTADLVRHGIAPYPERLERGRQLLRAS